MVVVKCSVTMALESEGPVLTWLGFINLSFLTYEMRMMTALIHWVVEGLNEIIHVIWLPWHRVGTYTLSCL